MVQTLNPTASYRDFLAGLSFQSVQGEPSWLSQRRQTAFELFRRLGFPSKKNEAWKNVNVEALLLKPFRPGAGKTERKGDAPFDCQTRIQLVNGRVNSIENRAGVEVLALSEALKRYPEKMENRLASAVESSLNPFDQINTFSFSEGLYLRFPEGFKSDTPVLIESLGEGGQGSPLVFYPRILVDLEEAADASLVFLQTAGDENPYFSNMAVEVYAGARAKCVWVHADRGSRASNHHARFHWSLSAESEIKAVSFFSGGELSYHDHGLTLAGEGASYELAGLAALTGKSHVTNIIHAAHQASHVTGRQFYKNLLGGESQGEFNSMVHVAAGTVGSDSDQLNRNLILSEKARSFSRPQLKIDADEVKATHGSATGQLSPQEIFYLQSRGLNRDEAKTLLASAFMNEVLEKIPAGKVRDLFKSWAAEELKTIG